MNGNMKVTAVGHETIAMADGVPAIAPVESHVAIVDTHPQHSERHLVGVGVGAAIGGAAGAVAGVVAAAATGVATGLVLGGPFGGVLGLVAGAVGGGMLGSSIGGAVNPSDDERFWKDAYSSEPYAMSAYNFDDYWPAYQTGIAGYTEHPGETFEDAECRLQDAYALLRGNSRLGWEDARLAARAAWERHARQIESQQY